MQSQGFLCVSDPFLFQADVCYSGCNLCSWGPCFSLYFSIIPPGYSCPGPWYLPAQHPSCPSPFQSCQPLLPLLSSPAPAPWEVLKRFRHCCYCSCTAGLTSLKCLDTNAKKNNKPQQTVLSALGLQPQLRGEVPNPARGEAEGGNPPVQEVRSLHQHSPLMGSWLWDIKEPRGSPFMRHKRAGFGAVRLVWGHLGLCWGWALPWEGLWLCRAAGQPPPL